MAIAWFRAQSTVRVSQYSGPLFNDAIWFQDHNQIIINCIYEITVKGFSLQDDQKLPFFALKHSS
jgi:hypothetical protein